MVNFTTVDRPVISAQVMDDFQVISVKIWYRNSDFQAFQESNMEYDTDTNEYAVTLQAQPEGKFEYYLQAYDGNNTSVYPIDGYFSAEVIDVKPNAWPFLIAVTIAILILVFLHGLLFFRSRKSINDAADSGDERVENDENPR
jgi:heme-degrading monooxygenase HmoA